MTTKEGKKNSRPLLIRFDEKTYRALKELSCYSDVPMRAIVSRALNAYGLEERILGAKREAGVE